MFEKVSGVFRGMNIRTQVFFDWLMWMSLERTRVGWSGSGVVKVFGYLLGLRVIVPSEFLII